LRCCAGANVGWADPLGATGLLYAAHQIEQQFMDRQLSEAAPLQNRFVKVSLALIAAGANIHAPCTDWTPLKKLQTCKVVASLFGQWAAGMSNHLAAVRELAEYRAMPCR
jgi:hypothetical protein